MTKQMFMYIFLNIQKGLHFIFSVTKIKLYNAFKEGSMKNNKIGEMLKKYRK